MSSLAIGLAVTALWALCATGVAWYVASVAGEVTYVTLADGRRQERSIPLLYRVLLPFAGNFDALISRPAFKGQTELADTMLVSAGFEGLLSGRELVALKLLTAIVVCPVAAAAAFLLVPALTGERDVCVALLATVLPTAFAFVQPAMWLRGALRRRHLAIQKELPFVLDILTLSIEAGMDFISALQRNCQTRKLSPLNEELLRMTKEIQVGSSRRDALKGMADRVGQQDLKSVAYALIQADELGVSIGEILRIQSEQMRSRRFDRAEKLAAEAPVKMLGPLMLCIFPAVFVVLLGPVLFQAMKGMF